MADKSFSLLVEMKADIEKFKKGMDQAIKKTTGIQGGFAKIAKLAAGAFAVGQLVQFGKESADLAQKAEGIHAAFQRLNDPSLLKNLREQTKGMLSDMELEKAAVRANNFNIPLEQVGTLLAFAQERAIDTGESIEYLSESIINGIARKSLPILDNLGLSATDVREEFQKTGDMAEAVGNIIKRSQGEAGERILTTAEKQAQFNASLQNMQVDLGNAVNSIKAQMLPSLTKFVEGLNEVLKTQEQIKREAWDESISWAISQDAAELESYTKKLEDAGVSQDDLKTRTKAYADYLIGSYKQILEGLSDEEADRSRGLKIQILELEKYKTAQDKLNQGYVASEEEVKKRIELEKELAKTLEDTALAYTKQLYELGQTKQKQKEQFLAMNQLEDMGIFSDNEMENVADDPEVAALTEKYLAMEDATKEFTDNMNAMLDGFVAGAITDLAAGLGEALASGNIEGFTQDMLKKFGSFTVQMGGMLIAYGIAMGAFKKAFANPVAAVAAGVALAAIGGAIIGAANSFNSSGTSGGGGSYGSAAYSNSENVVRFEIEGDKLIGVQQNYSRKTSNYN